MNHFPQKIPIAGRERMCLGLVRSQILVGKTLVDIGSSFGWLEKELIKSGAKLIGIEKDRDALAFAQKNVGPKAKFILGNVLNIPIQRDTADIVALFDVIEHIPRGTEERALREIRRILKKGGVLLLSTPHFHPITNLFDPAWYFGHRHYSEEKIKKLCNEESFKIIDWSVKGSIWNVMHLLWFYVMKNMFRQVSPQNQWFDKKDDEEYSQNGIFTIFAILKKI